MKGVKKRFKNPGSTQNPKEMKGVTKRLSQFLIGGFQNPLLHPKFESRGQSQRRAEGKVIGGGTRAKCTK